MTDPIKKLLKEKEKTYKSYLQNGFTDENRAQLKANQKECSTFISQANETYLLKKTINLMTPSQGQKDDRQF